MFAGRYSSDFTPDLYPIVPIRSARFDILPNGYAVNDLAVDSQLFTQWIICETLKEVYLASV
jgi:hypothetical protein